MMTRMLKEEGAEIRRFKVRRLMRERGLIFEQPGPHAYKQATVERPKVLIGSIVSPASVAQTRRGAAILPTSGPVSDGAI